MIKNNRGVIGIALALIVVCILFAGGYLYWLNQTTSGQNNSTPTATPTPVKSVNIGKIERPTDLEKWNNFTSEEGLFSLKYPQNWILVKPVKWEYTLKPSAESEYGISFGLQVYEPDTRVENLQSKIDELYSSPVLNILKHEVATLPQSGLTVHFIVAESFNLETVQHPKEKTDLETFVLIPGVPMMSVGDDNKFVCHSNGILGFYTYGSGKGNLGKYDAVKNAKEDSYHETLKQILSTFELGSCPTK